MRWPKLFPSLAPSRRRSSSDRRNKRRELPHAPLPPCPAWKKSFSSTFADADHRPELHELPKSANRSRDGRERTPEGGVRAGLTSSNESRSTPPRVEMYFMPWLLIVIVRSGKRGARVNAGRSRAIDAGPKGRTKRALEAWRGADSASPHVLPPTPE